MLYKHRKSPYGGEYKGIGASGVLHHNAPIVGIHKDMVQVEHYTITIKLNSNMFYIHF